MIMHANAFHHKARYPTCKKKAGKLVPSTQTLNHLPMRPVLLHYEVSLSRNAHRLKRGNSAMRIIIHHSIIRFIIGKMSKDDSAASAPRSTTTKLSRQTVIFPWAYLPTCLRNTTTNFGQIYFAILPRL